MDWIRWHGSYDRPGSSLAQRLVVVRDCVRHALAHVGADRSGERRLISICAGDGRDVLPVLAEHDETRRTRALLVELDSQLAERARASAAELGLPNVDVENTDAGVTDPYLDLVPAHVVLACGVFGNISPDHIRHTIATLPGMLSNGGIVIWTRGRADDGPDPAYEIREWFAEDGFTEMYFTAPDDERFRVGMHRLDTPTTSVALEPGKLLFTFIRHDDSATTRSRTAEAR